MEEDKETVQIVKTCICGCSAIQISKYFWTDEVPEYGINLYKNVFYTDQIKPLQLIGLRIKNAWYTLIGKDYLLFDLNLNEKDFQEFRKNINEIGGSNGKSI